MKIVHLLFYYGWCHGHVVKCGTSSWTLSDEISNCITRFWATSFQTINFNRNNNNNKISKNIDWRKYLTEEWTMWWFGRFLQKSDIFSRSQGWHHVTDKVVVNRAHLEIYIYQGRVFLRGLKKKLHQHFAYFCRHLVLLGPPFGPKWKISCIAHVCLKGVVSACSQQVGRERLNYDKCS